MINCIYNTNTIHCQSLLPGLGKTTMTFDEVIPLYNEKEKYTIMYSAPTIKLLNQVRNNLIEKGIDEKEIFLIESQDNIDIHTQVENLNITNLKKAIILITHISAINYCHYFDNIDVKIFDEEMEYMLDVMSYEYKDKEEKILFDKYIDFINVENIPQIIKLKLKQDVPKKYKRRSAFHRGMNKMFYQYLENNSFDLFVISETYIDFCDGKRPDFIYFKLAKPEIFKAKEYTYYLGYDVHNSLTSVIMDTINNIKFVEDISKQKNLQRLDYSNDFEISYMYRGLVGNKKIHSRYKNQVEIIKNFIKENNLINNSLYIWQLDKDTEFLEYLNNNNCHQLPSKAHGINNPIWMEYDTVALIANYRLNEMELKLCNILDISNEWYLNSRHINMLIQAMARCKIRKDNNVKIKLTVIDENTANQLVEKLSNGKNNITLKYLGLKYQYNTRSDKQDIDDKKQKEKIRGKINYLKKKETLTNKEKIKLYRLEEEYKASLIRK